MSNLKLYNFNINKIIKQCIHNRIKLHSLSNQLNLCCTAGLDNEKALRVNRKFNLINARLDKQIALLSYYLIKKLAC